MDEEFLLGTRTARRLYHEFAEPLPVIDWHNHLPVWELTENRTAGDLAELWLLNDPYKHRVMRICGVPEKFITGDAGHYEKFLAWSGTLPELVSNPLFDWSILELKRGFGIELPLNPANAEEIWNRANGMMRPAREWLSLFRVGYAAPCCSFTDDPAVFAGLPDVVPSLRGDELTGLSVEWLRRAGLNGGSFAGLCGWLVERIRAFHRAGCRFADLSLDDGFRYDPSGEPETLFRVFRAGDESVRPQLVSHLLRFLGGVYAGRGWTLLLHIGAKRDSSTRLRRLAGAAGGYAGIGCGGELASVISLLDSMESGGGLPRTVLFPLNPSCSAALAVLSGSFPGDGVRGKVQLGPAWWFCDHRDGMIAGFETIAAYGVLSTFIGMTTDSRSLLSFVRHEYFRRVFCGWIGEKVERGVFPGDFESLKNLVEAVCCRNAGTIITKG